MPGRVTLIIGGARSGKSRFAVELAAKRGQQVLFVATAEARDVEMEHKIAEHRRHRPSDWRTLEAPLSVGKAVAEELGDDQVVVLDCLTLLVSNILGRLTEQRDVGQTDTELLEVQVAEEIRALLDTIESSGASCYIVSNEVGSGLVPVTPLGRVYRDLLGRANQMVADRADEVYLMVAGLPVRVKPPLSP
jgi:adenosylcobinamide kinase/adenosylcobinamide-phosphate guanylyltransferase